MEGQSLTEGAWPILKDLKEGRNLMHGDIRFLIKHKLKAFDDKFLMTTIK